MQRPRSGERGQSPYSTHPSLTNMHHSYDNKFRVSRRPASMKARPLSDHSEGIRRATEASLTPREEAPPGTLCRGCESTLLSTGCTPGGPLRMKTDSSLARKQRPLPRKPCPLPSNPPSHRCPPSCVAHGSAHGCSRAFSGGEPCPRPAAKRASRPRRERVDRERGYPCFSE